ncbi:MAG: hypothetical protein HKN31_12755 [Pricia sp.]|nr:hypothetical protein [Pricia sp.]
MKKLAISLVIMGITTFGLAQNSHPRFEQFKRLDIESLGTNYAYLNEVQKGFAPNQVKYLENVVSYWDVTRSDAFTRYIDDPFEVTFKSSSGYITVNYDRAGRIVMAKERFKNVAVPTTIGVSILKEYPNWRISKSKYSVKYIKDKEAKKSFKVQLSKDHIKKWVAVDPSGNLS